MGETTQDAEQEAKAQVWLHRVDISDDSQNAGLAKKDGVLRMEASLI